LDVPALQRAYRRMRKDAAVGVDGVTKDDYGQDLEVRLADLHTRLRSKQYRHQPIRRAARWFQAGLLEATSLLHRVVRRRAR
jgi:hypothetical protein